MHVLIIPSEEFIPPANHTSAIFQYHQAVVLRDAGHKVGAISIRQEYSIPMILRAAMSRVAGRRVGNTLDDRTMPAMARLLRDKVARPDAFIRGEDAGGIPTVRIDGFYYLPPSPRTNHIGWIAGGLKAFAWYVANHGTPDVIHAHNLDSAGLLANRIRRENGIPYVVTEHSTWFRRGLIAKDLYPRLAVAAREASSFAAVSPGLARLLQRELALGRSEVAVVPNVIDPEFLRAPVSPKPVERRGFSFLTVGNLIPVKNHELLITAFHEAFAAEPEVFLRIGGDGELRSELEKLVASLEMQDRIVFIDRIDREAVLNEMDSCDAFVLPSRYETFGVVLIEAMARGRPVITTASDGPEAFVGRADGMIVPNENRLALAAAMRRMVAIAGTYDGAGIRRRAIERFGPEALLGRLEQMYRRALS